MASRRGAAANDAVETGKAWRITTAWCGGSRIVKAGHVCDLWGEEQAYGTNRMQAWEASGCLGAFQQGLDICCSGVFYEDAANLAFELEDSLDGAC